MKAYVEAYGCTLNFGEAREMEALLAAKGWELCGDPREADLSVLVTCVVIETTEREMLRRAKALSGSRALVVAGCMASACRDRIETVAPNARFVPPAGIESFSALLDGLWTGPPRPAPERPSYAIVPIATGCTGSCAYCITKLARGALRSRSLGSVVSAVREATAGGPREVQLTAQDAAAYGSDIGSGLPALVERVCSLPGEFRVRVGMMNPRSVPPIIDRVAGMYQEPKLFKFLHLPVQSGSDRLLADMGRGYTVSDFVKVVSAVRARAPELTLSTDLIVGYPGEAKADHEANLELISRVRPDIVNVTRFSPRPGTKAAGANDKVVGWKAKDRSREITELRFKVALEINRAWVGRRVRVLATEPGKNKTTITRTDQYKQLVVPGKVPLSRFYEATVEDATPTYLVGRVEATG